MPDGEARPRSVYNDRGAKDRQACMPGDTYSSLWRRDMFSVSYVAQLSLGGNRARCTAGGDLVVVVVPGQRG